MADKKFSTKTTDFVEAQNRFPHLLHYVNVVARDFGVPEFVTTLDRTMRNIESPNLIYPVGDPIFIHIYKIEGGKIKYHIIMPELSVKEEELYEHILDRIIEIAHTVKIPESQKELRVLLTNLFDEVVEVRAHHTREDNFFSFVKQKIALDYNQYQVLLFHLLKNRLGYGELEGFLRDMYIEDISCTGVGNIWIVHKIFGNIESNAGFQDDITLNKYIVESSERVESPVSEARPIVDAIMPDGSRVNYIFSRKVSLGGSSFTIRKFNETPISIANLVKWGTLNAEVAAYIWLCLENSTSLFVCGETASGKTTTLNAISTFIPLDNKIYSVEQTPEVNLPHPIWQHLVTRESGQDTDVKMFDLLIASLRSRPDYIIVGEIRGEEANITFQAMQTGHPVLSTFHAGSVHSMIQRLTGKPLDIPIAFMDNLNVVLIQAPVYLNGKVERRIMSVTELIRYSDEVGKVMTKEVFLWEENKDKFLFRGLYNSYILEQKVAKKMGLQEPREIYNILKTRAKVIQGLVDANIDDYFEVVKILDAYRKEGELALPF